MSTARLSPLDSSFLAVESPTAHMHVGWVASFGSPEDGPTPDFERVRDHIAARLGRAPRYRQRLQPVALGVTTPAWVDDERFEIERHVVRAETSDLMQAAAEAMSRPLDHERPLWEMTIVEGLDRGGIGVIGKAHHCMVDGLAAVELASLLLDPVPEPDAPPPDRWRPASAPAAYSLLLGRVLEGARERLRFAAEPLGALRSGERLLQIPRRLHALARAAVDTARPAPEAERLNPPLSTERHLGVVERRLDELRRVKRAFGATINDVLLASVAGALRAYLIERGQPPVALKTMVPVNLRSDAEGGAPGNRISFMFVDLPCNEPDRLRRLRRIRGDVGGRKAEGLAGASETMLETIAQFPHPAREVVSRLVARPRVFNLTVSNIPGPPLPAYMCGCLLETAYPIVPLPERHALSVGMTTVRDRACFGLYADRRSLPDVDRIATALDDELDALLADAAGTEELGRDRPRPVVPAA